MDFIYITILGAIQGATEFLPVSSSGHLAAGKLLFNMNSFADQPLLLEILLHIATLMAVIIVYRKDITGLLKGLIDTISALFKGTIKENIKHNKYVRLLALLIAGTIPTGIIGVTMEKSGIAGHVASSHILLGLSFLSCAIILMLGKLNQKTVNPLNFKLAFIIGIAQGIAVMPGISRSGTTIIVAMLLGIERTEAAKFSFLLSIPAILGAAVLDFDLAALANTGQTAGIISGFAAAFIVGIVALLGLIKLVKSGRLWLFAPYVATLGLLVMLFL